MSSSDTNLESPHIALPLRLNAGGTRVVCVEQDSEDEIFDCVEVLIRTPHGSRIDLPDYGLRDQEFTMGGAKKEEIYAAVEQWEGDRALIAIEESPSRLDSLVSNVRVGVTGRTHG